MIKNDVLCEACCRQHGRIFETCNNGCHIRDLFETLKAERDAAVADLTTIAKKFNRPCHWCKKEFDDGSTFCFMCDDEEHNGNFEWCGVQEEKHE